MKTIFELGVNYSKTRLWLIQGVSFVAIGLFLVISDSADSRNVAAGLTFIVYGILNYVVRLKTYHLTDSHLVIKRAFFPLRIIEQRFEISEIKKITFAFAKGMLGGHHLLITGKKRNGTFRIYVSRSEIDAFETALDTLGVEIIREGM